MSTFSLTLGTASHPFDKPEVRFGRTNDNDVVVADALASRSHARIFVSEEKFFVEDLGSGNGTKLNGVKLAAPAELKTGDTITIGDTVYTFTGPPPPPALDQTMREPLPELTQPPKRPSDDSITVPPGPPPELTELTPADANSTMLRPPPDFAAPQAVDPNATMLKPPPGVLAALKPADPNETLLKPPPELAAKLAARAPVRSELAIEDTGPVAGKAMTAAELARERREAQKSAGARISYAWRQLSKGARRGITIGSVAFSLAVAAGVVALLWPKPTTTLPPEPGGLVAGGEIIEASFGLGEGVMYARRDAKVFEFAAAGATRLVGVLHYQARDLSKNEVSLALNGSELGFVPADTLDVENRALEAVLPAVHIKKGESNLLVFDNVNNPPGDDPWRIWNIWLEIVAIPELGAEEMLVAVNEDLQIAQRAWETREVGAENLFHSWKSYRDAWLKLESMPSGRPEALYTESRQRLREVGAELDQRCSTMQLEVVKILGAKRPDYELARSTLQEALRYYPTREHRCHTLIRDMLEQVGGPR